MRRSSACVEVVDIACWLSGLRCLSGSISQRAQSVQHQSIEAAVLQMRYRHEKRQMLLVSASPY